MSISFKRKFGCLAFVGLLASVISFPPSSSTYAKSDTRELLFASKTNLEELDEFVTSNKNSMSALNNRKIKLVATYPKDTNDFSDYDSIAYNYKDVNKDKKLQKPLQSALADGKKVYLYGGLTLEEYCELLNIDRLNAQMELDDTKETVNVSFYDIEGDEKKEKKQKDDMERKPDYNKHEIIGYTLDKNAPYKLFISDINRYDENGLTP